MTQAKDNGKDTSSDDHNVEPISKQIHYFMADLSHQHAKQVVHILYQFSGANSLA